ncbi:peptidyl-prolyl cis-trans isomerase [Balneola sp. MJW-20]|uniref:peptidyl-prolyl cis-trans isomerase n=1 Tax=Gracilimonas aurantiaca TaxID=3234185 RepID=UPI00346733D0
MRQIVALSVLLLISLSGCSNRLNNDNQILARVGNESLTLSEARANIPVQVFSADSIMAYQQYTDSWIRRQIILQEADRLNFANRPEVRKELDRVRDEYILQFVQDYIVGEFEDEIQVSSEEARNYYQENKETFTLPERHVRYRHLIARSLSDASNARQELMQAVPWEEVAKKYSLYPELKIRESERFWPISMAGGDINMLNRYLKVIGPSEISPIHQDGNEYHFVQLLDEKAEGDHPDLDWLITQIQEWLTLEKRKRVFNTYVKNLYLQGQANNEIITYDVLPEQTDSNIAITEQDTLNNAY